MSCTKKAAAVLGAARPMRYRAAMVARLPALLVLAPQWTPPAPGCGSARARRSSAACRCSSTHLSSASASSWRMRGPCRSWSHALGVRAALASSHPQPPAAPALGLAPSTAAAVAPPLARGAAAPQGSVSAETATPGIAAEASGNVHARPLVCEFNAWRDGVEAAPQIAATAVQEQQSAASPPLVDSPFPPTPGLPLDEPLAVHGMTGSCSNSAALEFRLLLSLGLSLSDPHCVKLPRPQFAAAAAACPMGLQLCPGDTDWQTGPALVRCLLPTYKRCRIKPGPAPGATARQSSTDVDTHLKKVTPNKKA